MTTFSLSSKQTCGHASLKAVIRAAFRAQLYVQLLNKIICWYVEALKIVCIGAAILHGYFGVRFGHTNPIIPVFCGLVHVCSFSFYCGGFQRAYRVKEMQLKLKQELLARRTGGLARKKVILKQANALHCMGIQVGNFHEMERNSALVFIDYVESQLISLLIAF